jgi:hypothetical protein
VREEGQRKAEVKKRNAHKREVLGRREDRDRGMGNATAGRLIPHCHPRPQIENIENIDEYTDSESISTLAPESNTDEDADDDSKYIRSDTAKRSKGYMQQ